MRNLVIFDWDGVIADSCPSFLVYYRETANHFKKEFPVKTLDEFKDWYDSAWEQNFIKLGFTEAELPLALNHEASQVNYDNIPLFPGIKEAINIIAKKYTLSIASTTDSKLIRKKMEKENILNLFELISGGEGGTSDKKAVIQKVLDKTGILPEKAVMVGDTIMDIKSSKALNIKNIIVGYGWNSVNRLKEASPDYLVSSPGEIIATIDKILT